MLCYAKYHYPHGYWYFAKRNATEIFELEMLEQSITRKQSTAVQDEWRVFLSSAIHDRCGCGPANIRCDIMKFHMYNPYKVVFSMNLLISCYILSEMSREVGYD